MNVHVQSIPTQKLLVSQHPDLQLLTIDAETMKTLLPPFYPVLSATLRIKLSETNATLQQQRQAMIKEFLLAYKVTEGIIKQTEP